MAYIHKVIEYCEKWIRESRKEALNDLREALNDGYTVEKVDAVGESLVYVLHKYKD